MYEVTKYHRTLETQLTLLAEAGLGFEALREGRPRPEQFSDPCEYERCGRIPLLLIVSRRVEHTPLARLHSAAYSLGTVLR